MVNVPRERSCPFLASRWNRELRGTTAGEDNACYLWEESGVPPDVIQFCGGLGRWHGEPFVPIPVEMQYSVCTQEHYGTCRWLREQRWHTRETGLVCPLLGSPSDRHHKYLYPTRHNVCHGGPGRLPETPPRLRRLLAQLRTRWTKLSGGGRGLPVAPETQRSLCLTQQYVDCPHYTGNGR